MTSENRKSMENWIEPLCEPIECESIITGLTDFSLFKMAKKGYIRLVKDNRKRRYALELFNHDSSKVFPQDKSQPLKPLYSFEVYKHPNTTNKKKSLIWIYIYHRYRSPM